MLMPCTHHHFKSRRCLFQTVLQNVRGAVFSGYPLLARSIRQGRKSISSFDDVCSGRSKGRGTLSDEGHAMTTMEGLETERSRRISLLALDVDLINEEPSADLSYSLSENAFRQDGVSIGTDYLRIEGVTVTRGALVPSALQMQHDVLGRGAFSIVRRAVWKKNGREEDCPVAVKEWSLHGDASRNRRQMLIKELTTLRQLDCPNLLGLHGAFLQEDGVTMVLEYMDRGSLQDWLQKNNASGKSGPDECFLAAASFQMLLGLSYLHERRCLHRDMKPANVLMHSNGAVKLCDFGLASLLSEQSCNATVVGTTSFMAPERLRAQPYGRASDIWALGLVLATCCTGEMPFRNVTSIVELLVTIEETATTDLLPENTSAGLREIFLGCLQVEPSKRIPANLLLQSPWYSGSHGIHSREDAMRLMRISLDAQEPNDVEELNDK